MRRASTYLLSTIAKSLLKQRNLTRIPQSLPFRPIQTLPSIPSPPPPPTTTEEIAAAVGERDGPKLALSYLNLAQQLDCTVPDDPEKTLTLALKALKIFEAQDTSSSLPVAKTLLLVASATHKLRRFDDSLNSLTTAEQILGRLEVDGFPHPAVSAAVQDQLASTKASLGRRRDALVNLRRSLELKAAYLETDSLELTAAYKDLGEAYAVVLDFGEALPLCLKALAICGDSAEEAKIRRLLGVIYVGLGENEVALEQIKLSRVILQNSSSEDELLLVEIEGANVEIALGRLEEAINTLKGVMQRADKDSEARVLALVSMAKALYAQEKFGDSKRCLEISCSILDKKESTSPGKVAEAFADISMLYEAMTEFETALSLMKRTLAVLEKLPEEQHLEGSISARVGWLLLLSGRVTQAIPYLESAVGRLKESFGPKHFGIGFAYKHLGQAYFETNQLQPAVQMLALAKDIICQLFGPHHEDSIDTYQCLANVYGAMGSYARGMEFQQQVVDAWESHGPSAHDEFREAHRLLEQLRRKAQGSSSAVFPANTLPLPSQK